MYKKWKNHRGQILDSKNGFDVIECEVCEFKHIIPIPTKQELKNIYRDEYYTREKPFYLKRTYEDLEWWNLIYADRYDTFEKNLPSDRRSILDIGTGPGFFLLYGKKRGWNVLGIEPSKQAAEHAKSLGIKIIEEFMDRSLANKLNKFDVIHMSEVLEHVPDPTEMIKITHDLLKPGGLLCVSAPNDYSPFQKVLREICAYKPWWVTPPFHINYFNFDSLEKLLRKIGFKIIIKETTFPIDIFLLMGDCYIGNNNLGRQCHKKRKQFELLLNRGGYNDLKRKLYRYFAEVGVGRVVVLYGKKQSNSKYK